MPPARARVTHPRAAPKELRLAFAGFGHVGRRFAELLAGPYGRILRQAGVRVIVTGVATGRHGLAIDANGLAPRRLLRQLRAGRSLATLHRGGPLATTRAFVERVPADVLVELTPLEPRTGQPATDHCAMALRRGLHVITANKGPVAFAARRLGALARRHGVRFQHEGAVMDGFPVFNLAGRCLRGATIGAFRGVLNSTTTRILSRMEAGVAFEVALAEAQAAGVAEADPANDLDGWDAAVKGCALANALMGAAVLPSQVVRTGIRGLTAAEVAEATAAGQRWRLVVRAARAPARRGGAGPRRAAPMVTVRVAPERLPLGDLLVAAGQDGVLVLDTDLMGEVGLAEGSGGIDQTAYAILSDLLEVARDESRPARRAGRRSAAQRSQR